MPTKVRIKVSILILVALLPVIGFLSEGFGHPFRTLGALLYLGVGLYIVWCFWPRFTLGVSKSQVHQGFHGEASYSLSFDDGPTPGLTEKVLDLLKAYRQRAYFFVLVSKAEQAPDLIRRMVAEGHVVGLHGWDHQKPFFKSKARIQKHLGLAKAQLESLTGVPVTLYRPSHGWKNLALVRVVRELGLNFCFWDYGVWDTDNPSCEALVSRLCVAAEKPSNHRPIALLLHDGRGDAPGVPAHGQVLLEGLKAFLDEKTR